MKQYQLQSEELCPANFKIDYQQELNEEQLKVVQQGEGPCLVLAGAGSGKTRTLVYRVAYLIEKGINPKNIFLVTFTNKAAKEMLNRVEVLLKCQPKGLWGGTFHHIGNTILRRYAPELGYTNKFTILDQEDAKTFLKAVMGELQLNYRDKYFPKVDVIQNIISFSANSQRPVNQVIEEKYSYLDPKLISVIEIIERAYQQKKLKTNVMDFDDLLLNWLKLLKTKPEVKNKLAGQFKYILVDEFQDTNKIQAEIIYELGSVHKNVLVVGDDCQSIYSFRAADVNNILFFPEHYKAAKIFKIERNYRSSPEILALANESIKNNLNQYEKNLEAVCEKKQRPALVALRDSEQQAQFVCQRILELQEENVCLDDIAILFRSSFQVMEMELELNKRSIPYTMRGGIKFFEQAHIKDVVAYLKVINNFNDELSWKRILLLYQGIGPAISDKIWQEIKNSKNIKEAAEILLTIPGSEKVIRALENLNALFQDLLKDHQDFIATAIKHILKSDYENYVKANYENAKDRLEDLNQLANFAVSYNNLEDFLADVTLSESFRGEGVEKHQEGPDESLVLSTIHQAKGLEWKYVFIIGLVDGQFPHYKVFENPEEIEEERRLFYVAVTRAKDELYLTYPIITTSYMTGTNLNKPSSFITELDDSLFEPWQINEPEYADNDDNSLNLIGKNTLAKHEFLSSVTYEELDE
jgi:DNA helicase-2/ATP-dependent DNA helicase PcrA